MRRVEEKTLIRVNELSEIDKRKIVWEIIQLLQKEELSYQQAVDLLEVTKVQLKNIPVKIF